MILTQFLITENIISSLTSRSLFTGVSSNGTVMKPDISVHNTSYIVSNHFFYLLAVADPNLKTGERQGLLFYILMHSSCLKGHLYISCGQLLVSNMYSHLTRKMSWFKVRRDLSSIISFFSYLRNVKISTS